MPNPANPNLTYAFAVSIVIVTLLVSLSSFLVRRAVTKVLETVDRVPQKEWFDKVEKALDDLPDRNRWEDHFKRNHDISQVVNRHEFEITSLKRFEAEARAQLKELDRRKHNDNGAA